MTESQEDQTDEGAAFSRRDVLKTVGSAGAIGTLGAETAVAKKPKQFYVGTKPGKADVAKRRASEVSHVVEMEEIGPTVVGRWPEEALRGLRNNPHIRYVEEEQFDQPLYDLPDEILPWGVDRVDAEEVHGLGHTGSGVDVAVSDSGIDSDHPDLNTGTGYATTGAACSSCDEDWDDTDGHGTHVAGTIGAIDNDEGVIGVAPDVTLHAVKIFPSGGHDQIKEGLKWAADQGYDVVNMSHGGSDTQTKKDGIDYAHDKGVLLVAAAGNDGFKPKCDDDDCIGYPAAYDDVIAVSNVTDDDTLSGSSSVGSEMDIAGPGDQIRSTWNDGEYNTISGTSMATPHVSGAGALLIEGGEDADGARTKLENTAEDIGLDAKEQGNGLLDVAAALGHNTANDLLEVETNGVGSTDYTEADLNGQLTQLTGSASADVYFEWGPVGGGFPNTTPGTNLTSTGFFGETITGLVENTEYQYQAVVTNAEGSIERGETETFFTDDNPDPVGAITHSPLTPNVGNLVEFDASSSNPGGFPDSIVSYEWDLDDDGSFDDATGSTTSRVFTTGGSTTVEVRVTDEFGQTDVAAETFTVNEFPTAAVTVSPSEPNEGESTTFDASGSFDPEGDPLTYEWDWNDDGTFEESTPSDTTTHTFADGGDKTVTLRVTDDNGATDTETVDFHVNHFPTASFAPPTAPNEDEPVSFDASGSTDSDGTVVQYEWDWDDDGTFEESTPSATTTHTFANGGDKMVTLRVTDDDGATDTTTESFYVNKRPTASFTVSPNPVVRDEPATFDASESSDPEGGPLTYEWDWDDDGTFEESTSNATPDHTFTTGGEHTVALRVTDDNGATSDPVTTTFTVYIRVEIDIAPNANGANPINPGRKGDVPVAVLHTSAFDPPAELDPSTVRFGAPDDVGFDSSDAPEGGATPAHPGGHVEDVNEDGSMDSVFHFLNSETGFDSADTEGELVGLTTDGVPVFATDAVKIVGRGKP